MYCVALPMGPNQGLNFATINSGQGLCGFSYTEESRSTRMPSRTASLNFADGVKDTPRVSTREPS